MNPAGSYRWERPQHQVTLTQSFYMQQTEVTQAQWDGGDGEQSRRVFPDAPRVRWRRVSWNDVQDFITAMNARWRGDLRFAHGSPVGIWGAGPGP